MFLGARYKVPICWLVARPKTQELDTNSHQSTSRVSENTTAVMCKLSGGGKLVYPEHMRCIALACTQCLCYSRNIGQVTLKNITFIMYIIIYGVVHPIFYLIVYPDHMRCIASACTQCFWNSRNIG